eukprot:COSAG01_NODE_16163_length_1263_cov_4.553265_1_plen_95_part_10
MVPWSLENIFLRVVVNRNETDHKCIGAQSVTFDDAFPDKITNIVVLFKLPPTIGKGGNCEARFRRRKSTLLSKPVSSPGSKTKICDTPRARKNDA